jgi:hypothetical protein
VTRKAEGDRKWSRIPEDPEYTEYAENVYELKFIHWFGKNDTVYFAFTYPWSYTEN